MVDVFERAALVGWIAAYTESYPTEAKKLVAKITKKRSASEFSGTDLQDAKPRSLDGTDPSIKFVQASSHLLILISFLPS